MDYFLEEFESAHPIKKIFIILWAVLFVGGLFFSIFYLANNGFEKTFDQFFGHGITPVTVSVFLFIFVIRTAFYIPVSFLMIASPFIFGGFINGVIMSAIGEMIGAVIGFLASRYYLQEFFQRYKKRSLLLQILNEKMNYFGGIAVMILRISPVSFDIINIGAGMSTMSFVKYLKATFISIWPKVIIFVSIGSAINSPIVTFYTVFSVLILVGIIYCLKSNKKYKEIFDMRLKSEMKLGIKSEIKYKIKK